MHWTGYLERVVFAAFASLVLHGQLASAASTGYSSAGSLKLSGDIPLPIFIAMNASIIDDEPYWLESIPHRGKAAYNSNPSYQVFRNVKDFGARGDGVTDDTYAINLAISSGGRCGEGTCPSSTITPALVYFPRGVYLVSSPIIAYYYTQLIGDAKRPPTLLASATFYGIAVIDADPYIAGGGGAQWYGNTNNFFRSVRNFIIDLRRVPAYNTATGLHWQVAQATSLFNITVDMSTDPSTAHQGIFMENGSGGFMSDLTFNGGKYGIWGGNQQFTLRNVAVNNAQTAIYIQWNWGWTFQGVQINNCKVGFDLFTSSSTQGVGAVAIIDADVKNTPTFLRVTQASSSEKLAGSLVLDNINLVNVPVAVSTSSGTTILQGGTKQIEIWVQGNVYGGAEPDKEYIRGSVHPTDKPSSLLTPEGRIFGKVHPQYTNLGTSDIISIKACGAKGDGKSDDTIAVQAALDKYGPSKVIFFDAGTYVIRKAVTIPAGSRIVGEAWSVIAGAGPAFADVTQPRVMVRVGAKGSQGVVEISDMMFTTIGPAAGAIVIEWNIKEPAGQQGGAGMWDSHIRLGGAAGTNLQYPQCPPGSTASNCMGAYLALHLTEDSTAYLEGTWVWLADHDLDGSNEAQISIYAGRGILSESKGPVWMIGTAEHFVLYQYRLVNAKDHYMGLIQTESPYFQPSPPAPLPFGVNQAFHDPDFPSGVTSAWGLSVENSTDIIVFGAGLYSFFDNYSQECIGSRNCQPKILDVDTESKISIFSLSTVASTFQVSLDGNGIVDQAKNINGFASTVTLWRGVCQTI